MQQNRLYPLYRCKAATDASAQRSMPNNACGCPKTAHHEISCGLLYTRHLSSPTLPGLPQQSPSPLFPHFSFILLGALASPLSSGSVAGFSKWRLPGSVKLRTRGRDRKERSNVCERRLRERHKRRKKAAVRTFTKHKYNGPV